MEESLYGPKDTRRAQKIGPYRGSNGRGEKIAKKQQ